MTNPDNFAGLDRVTFYHPQETVTLSITTQMDIAEPMLWEQ